MNHIANRTQSINPFARATLTIKPIGTWRDEKAKRDVTETLYAYQCGADRYTVTVWHKPKAKPLFVLAS
jgi:hypothetical protein